MAGIATVVFGLMLAASLAQGVQICGLNYLQRCNALDEPCIVNQDIAFRNYSTTAQGRGFFLTPLDVIYFDQINFDVGQRKVYLNKVTITGLLRSRYEVTSAALRNTQFVFTDYYTHNLLVEAESSSLVDLATGVTTVADNNPVSVEIFDANTVTVRPTSIVRRCTGVDFALTIPGDTVVTSGAILVLNGLEEVLTPLDFNDFGFELVSKVAAVGTNFIIRNKKTLFNIVSYDTLYYS